MKSDLALFLFGRLWECHPAPSTVATVTTKPQALSFEWVAKMEGRVSSFIDFSLDIFSFDKLASLAYYDWFHFKGLKTVFHGAVFSYKRMVSYKRVLYFLAREGYHFKGLGAGLIYHQGLVLSHKRDYLFIFHSSFMETWMARYFFTMLLQKNLF